MDEPFTLQSEVWHSRLKRLRTHLRSAMPFASGILATLVALLVYNAVGPTPPLLTEYKLNDSIAQVMASATPPPAFSAHVYQVILPSLVIIQTESQNEEGEDGRGVGSGVVVSADGDILTSLHVVDGASDIQITFADGTKSSARVSVEQPENDIAVLSPSQLPELVVPAVLGNPNAMRVGDEAYVVGNPLGLSGSMSAGVISGFNRSFKPKNGDQRLENLIQIDAAVNPGNSGGPLLNRNGQVVGIVTALVNPSEEGVFIGIGFAVPITIAAGAAGLPPY